SRFVLPPPLEVLKAFWGLLIEASTWRHAAVTVYETLFGFVLATVFGVGLGALLAKVPLLERVLSPFIIATQVVPKVALIPLFILWFGFGPTSKIV
ncbi:ABC transporter permease, partial [Pseudomonas aeruginosa]|uniref:ABC transporter permease n=1 Tax=Pseudomonas aeruginosa TaxID=287 RepID=UPI002FA76750